LLVGGITDVSEQLIILTFKGQEIFFGCLTPEDGSGMLFRIVSNKLPNNTAQHSEKTET